MSVSLTASLTALPTELLTLIVTKIASKSALCNLARCSHQLYLCTIPHLYGHISIQEVGTQQDERLIMLTASLLRKPDLAKLVRQFSLHVPRSRFKECLRANLDDGDFATAVDPSGVEEVINYLGRYDHSHNFRHDFVLSFLLPSLLKVEKLVLDVDIHYHCHFLEEAIRSAVAKERPLDTQQPFGALTVFNQSPRRWHYAREIGSIASLLKLPTIREISGDFIRYEDPPDDYYFNVDFDQETVANSNLQVLDSSSSPLTNLDLAIHDVLIVDMRHILRVPIALKNFSIMLCGLYDDCEELPYILEPQKNCLESITIDCDQSFSFFHSTIEERYLLAPMASFARFRALKVFTTTGLFLTKTIDGSERHSLLNIFPPSLETLHLTRFQSDFNQLLQALERLLVYKSPQQIPSLTTLILEETVSDFLPRIRLKDVLWEDTQDIATEKLSEVAKSQNVVFEVIEEWTSGQGLGGQWDGGQWDGG